MMTSHTSSPSKSISTSNPIGACVCHYALTAFAAVATVGWMAAPAQAQVSSSEIGGVQSVSNSGTGEVRTHSYSGNKSVLGGPGYFTTNVGAGFSGGLSNSSTMLNLGVGYNIEYGPQLTGKALVDLNLATGSDTSRFIDVAVGANFFPVEMQLSQVKPYIGGDAGVGFVRTTDNRSADSIAVAGALGFQMLTSQTNIDVSMRYEILAQQIEGNNPQVLGLRVGMNY